MHMVECKIKILSRKKKYKFRDVTVSFASIYQLFFSLFVFPNKLTGYFKNFKHVLNFCTQNIKLNFNFERSDNNFSSKNIEPGVLPKLKLSRIIKEIRDNGISKN